MDNHKLNLYPTLKSLFNYSFSSQIFCASCLLLFSFCNACSSEVSPEEKTSNPDEKITETKYGDPVMDSDGTVYNTIKIGSQIWMAEDLRKTELKCLEDHPARFTNGLERGPEVKLYVREPRFAWYKNRKDSELGVIYNYSVVQYCELCPTGFRVATKADWEKLIEEVGGSSVAAKALGENGKTGFNAKIGGRIDSYGSVLGDNIGFWWCGDPYQILQNAKQAYNFQISKEGFVLINTEDIRTGNYIRCIQE